MKPESKILNIFWAEFMKYGDAVDVNARSKLSEY